MIKLALEDIVTNAVLAAGYEFYSMSVSRHSGVDVLRVCIDNVTSVTLDDCIKADKQIKFNLSANDYDPGNYSIEVSSPGLTRELSCESHFLKVIGKLIKIKYKDQAEAVNKSLFGILKDCSGGSLLVSSEDSGDVAINLENVIKSSLCLEEK